MALWILLSPVRQPPDAPGKENAAADLATPPPAVGSKPVPNVSAEPEKATPPATAEPPPAESPPQAVPPAAPAPAEAASAPRTEESARPVEPEPEPEKTAPAEPPRQTAAPSVTEKAAPAPEATAEEPSVVQKTAAPPKAATEIPSEEPAPQAKETGTRPAPPAAAEKAETAPPLPTAMPKLPPPQRSAALSRAPDPGLIESSKHGALPIVGRDGREAWRVYARPFDQSDRRPRIAIVLYGVGPSASATRTAIQGLPGPITLAFSPYADNLERYISEARLAGHEVLMLLPMEPTNYPQFDPGPKGLLTTLDTQRNIDRLEWVLSRSSGYIGVASYMGSRFTRVHRHMGVVLEQLRRRGLLYLESETAAAPLVGEMARLVRIPYAANALYLDQRASRPAIDSQLRELETLARKQGQAVAMAYPYPVTLERLSVWSRQVGKRDFSLAPLSALARRGG